MTSTHKINWKQNSAWDASWLNYFVLVYLRVWRKLTDASQKLTSCAHVTGNQYDSAWFDGIKPIVTTESTVFFARFDLLARRSRNLLNGTQGNWKVPNNKWILPYKTKQKEISKLNGNIPKAIVSFPFPSAVGTTQKYLPNSLSSVSFKYFVRKTWCTGRIIRPEFKENKPRTNKQITILELIPQTIRRRTRTRFVYFSIFPTPLPRASFFFLFVLYLKP